MATLNSIATRTTPKYIRSSITDPGTSTSAFLSGFTTGTGDWQGELVRLSNTTIVVGTCYYLKSDGAWTATDVDATPEGEKALIGLAVGTNSNTHGLLVKGYMRFNSGAYVGTAAIGGLIYLSDTAGKFTFTKPTTTDFAVRVVGYCVIKDGSNHIVVNFNPDKSWVILA